MNKIFAKVLHEKSKSVLIIPFIFTKEFTRVIEELPNAGWKTSETAIRKNILTHINCLISNGLEDEDNGSIGREFVLKDDFREVYELPKNPSNTFHLVNEKEELCHFKIKQISLFVFTTQVGFLTYEINHTYNDLDSIIMTNYLLKHQEHLRKGWLETQKERHIAKDKQKESSAKNESTEPLSSGQDKEKPKRTLASITSSLLNNLDIISYFSSVTDKPETAIVYSSIMMDKKFELEENCDKKIGRYLFYLRRSFKESYKPAPADLDLTNNSQVVQLFENSYWGVSLEGLSNLVYLTKDEVTNSFFEGNYRSNLAQSYFYLYMIALHQRYALIALNSTAQSLTFSGTLSDKEFDDIQNTRKKINYFILRCFFKHVSSVTHQQKLYEIIVKNLQIEELKEDLRLELEAFSSIAELQRYYQVKDAEKAEKISKEAEKAEKEEKERKEQTKREKHADTFLIYSTIFAIIATITGSWQLLTDLFVKSSKPLLQFPAVWALVILTIIFIIIGIFAYNSVQKKWKSTE